MKVDRINHYISEYKKYLSGLEEHPALYKYDALMNFRANWDPGELDLKEMFDRSFKSRISNRLWGGSVRSAKSVMLDFIEHDREFVRSMFRNLLDHSKDLNMRVNRFAYHCDQLVDKVYTGPRDVRHHRQDLKSITLYLAFDSPEKYIILDYDKWSRFFQKLEVREMPQHFDAERMTKLSTAFYKVIGRDEELSAAHARLLPGDLGMDTGLFLVHDIYTYFASPKEL